MDGSRRVCASMFYNSLLRSTCFEESVFCSGSLNRFESEFCESWKVCAEIYVARFCRLNCFDKVEFCELLSDLC